MRGALRGCLALVSRRDPSGAHAALPAPSDAEAAELVRTCVSHVFIRALAAADRQLALRLLAAALEGYGDALAASGIDLFEYTLSSGGG